MAEKRIVGNATPRVEGEQKVSGQAGYAVDVTLPDMLWVKVLRSPIAHGRIKRTDIGRANFGDYKISTIQDIPLLRPAVTQSNAGSGPYNSMSIGETAIMPTAAAIANAVEDAVGVRVKSLPITAEKVLNNR
jgi:CO/xanthine dehydrogenase Mo-binding subunit